MSYDLSNRVSVEFFPSYFLVKDLYMGTSLMRGHNVHDIYCAPLSCPPQINVATLPLSAVRCPRLYVIIVLVILLIKLFDCLGVQIICLVHSLLIFSVPLVILIKATSYPFLVIL